MLPRVQVSTSFMNQIRLKLFIFLFILLLCLQAGFLIFISGEGIKTPDQPPNLRLPYAGDNLPRSKIESNTSQALNFLFFGDLMLDRHVGEQISKNGLDYIFAELTGEENRFFKGIDLVSANLEGAVTDNGAHYAPNMAYDFAFSPELINQLKQYNFNFFNLANNHFTDQGSRGVDETSQNLDQLGFNYSGCPDGEIGECSSTIVEIGSQKIGMAGFSIVYSRFDLISAQKIISQLTSQTDLIIVNIHWGAEYEHQFNSTQQSIAHSLIDAGVDIIIGHHPHVAQGVEIYQNKPIFYSLGNFVFDQYFSSDTQEGLAVGVNLTDDKRHFFLFPMQSHLSQVELMTGKTKQDFLRRFIEWSMLDQKYKEQIRAGRLALD